MLQEAWLVAQGRLQNGVDDHYPRPIQTHHVARSDWTTYLQVAIIIVINRLVAPQKGGYHAPLVLTTISIALILDHLSPPIGQSA